MPVIAFPYGKEEWQYQIEEDRFAGCLDSGINEYKPELTETELVREALQNPVDSPKLSELAAGKKKVVVIASDHTRPVPSKIIMPLMLEEIRKGNPEAEITIVIATGCHRDTSRAELAAKFGEEIVQKETIVIHNCDDQKNLITLGTLPSGGELVINRLAVEADLLVAEGFIEPHFFAGFSGGRKSVLPGICSRKTVLYNHNAGFIAHEAARTGVLEGNPIHGDMIWAAKKANLAFICNVVLNSGKKVVYATAGDVEKAHEKGCAFLNELCQVKHPAAEIVITTNGGYPLDQNVYQAVKGMTAAESVVKENGVIIMLAKSDDGHGGSAFYQTFAQCRDLAALMRQFEETLPEDTIIDQWQSQIFARVLLKASVIYISEVPDEMIKEFHMIPAHSIEEAVVLADRILAEQGICDGKILAIPDGVSVIAKEMNE